MKKAIILASALALSLGLFGCGGQASESAGGESQPKQESQEQQAAALDFDGSGMSDTGAGMMYLSTAGGTSESGNVPEIANPGSSAVMSIGLNYEGGDGSVCAVYVDGMENMEINANEYLGQYSVVLEGDALAPGVHTVEVVAMDGDAATIYKSAQYEVAE